MSKLHIRMSNHHHRDSCLANTILARTTWTNSSEGKPDLVLDQDQQYKIAFKIEGKAADRTAKGYKFICPIFRLDKTSIDHQKTSLRSFGANKFVTLNCPIILQF